MSTNIAIFRLIALISLITLSHGLYISQKRTPSSTHHLHLPQVQIEGGVNEDNGPKKRPFCNAFTGCGRKRSQLPPLTGVGFSGGIIDARESMDDVEESLGTLLDLSAEPAVEDLSRQIMSEAKLWEAIQEANMEIMKQKELQATEEENASAALAAVTAEEQQNSRSQQMKCSLPSCIAI